MRCRRWMIGTLIPQTRELLKHVRKLSQLAGDDDASARARARRARRSLKVGRILVVVLQSRHTFLLTLKHYTPSFRPCDLSKGASCSPTDRHSASRQFGDLIFYAVGFIKA